ncbi:hypothetical protein BDW59DRAFT_152572 [Aspergillus cavernicola]|uniref:Uncharacterized protein n=1 Tax=Aspergillus cavernicola TaxID=176166 RepID=A0ABR4HQ89_9EURO
MVETHHNLANTDCCCCCAGQREGLGLRLSRESEESDGIDHKWLRLRRFLKVGTGRFMRCCRGFRHSDEVKATNATIGEVGVPGIAV